MVKYIHRNVCIDFEIKAAQIFFLKSFDKQARSIT